MAKLFVGIEAREYISKEKIKLEIFTTNDGQVISIQPSPEDRKRLLRTIETVTLPKRIWNKIPYVHKYWDAEHNTEPKQEAES